MSTRIPPDAIPLEVQFAADEDMPVLLANVFVVQQQQEDEFVLTIGQVSPLVSGATPEEQRQSAKKLGKVNVKVIARIALTKTRLTELTGILQGLVLKDKQAEGG